MYKNLKFMIYTSIAGIIILTLMAFLATAGLKEKNVSNNDGFQNEQFFNEEKSADTRKPIEFNSIKVSEDTKNYIYNSGDPLKEIDKENEDFETPEISNIKRAEKKEQKPLIVEYDPFKTETKQDTQKNNSTAGKSEENIVLYNINNTKAVDYDIMADFKLENTQFYVIAQKLDNMQRFQDFTVRKYYIYKKSGKTLVQCFELFQRQERANKDLKSLISVKTMSEDTEITFNSEANGVTRVVDNHRLLSPYGDKKDRVLLIKSE